MAYNLIDTRNAFTTRSLDPASRDTVLSGLLLHLVRKPSSETLLAAGGINVKSDGVAQICASAPRFRGLISACTTDPSVVGNTSASGTLFGGIGIDPVFSRYAPVGAGALVTLICTDYSTLFVFFILFLQSRSGS